MQITLVSSGDTVSDVLSRFEAKFFPECPNDEFKKKFSHSLVVVSECLITYSIRELKAMNDFLATTFNVDLGAPKRNSKVSLAGWIAEVLLSAREVAEASGATEQIADIECLNCGFVHGPFQNTLCPNGEPSPLIIDPNEIEVLEPEEKPVYKISMHPDRRADQKGWGFIVERVTVLPPYLLDREGNLFEKSSYMAPLCDATYAQIASKHLSSIAEKHGQPIELTTDDLVSVEAHVHDSPPPFIVNNGGVYKRMTWGMISWGKVVKYAQVVSEYLSNIVMV